MKGHKGDRKVTIEVIQDIEVENITVQFEKDASSH